LSSVNINNSSYRILNRFITTIR